MIPVPARTRNTSTFSPTLLATPLGPLLTSPPTVWLKSLSPMLFPVPRTAGSLHRRWLIDRGCPAAGGRRRRRGPAGWRSPVRLGITRGHVRETLADTASEQMYPRRGPFSVGAPVNDLGRRL